jgi:hypothetical protein
MIKQSLVSDRLACCVVLSAQFVCVAVSCVLQQCHCLYRWCHCAHICSILTTHDIVHVLQLIQVRALLPIALPRNIPPADKFKKGLENVWGFTTADMCASESDILKVICINYTQLYQQQHQVCRRNYIYSAFKCTLRMFLKHVIVSRALRADHHSRSMLSSLVDQSLRCTIVMHACANEHMSCWIVSYLTPVITLRRQ